MTTGTTTIVDSAIIAKGATGAPGGLEISGTATITNTTIANNVPNTPLFDPVGVGGGGITMGRGTVILTNVTVADNLGGIAVSEGTVLLRNTVLARNSFGTPFGPSTDCVGPVTSLGSNVLGSTTSCTIDLASTDLVGDPGLAAFIDDGTPGNAHIPLLAESPAIDAADRTACTRRDQLGHRRIDGDGDRRKFCDISAVEFVP